MGETTTQRAISKFKSLKKIARLRVARIKWMGQAQAAVFTGSTRTAAPRATSGLHGFSAVATEPRGGLSPYLDERVQYRTPPRGPALRAKSARRQCCMTPPAPPPPPAPRTPLPRSPSMTWSRVEERHVARRETITQRAI